MKIAVLKGLRHARKQRGLTVEQLSAVSKIDAERIVELEGGERSSKGELTRLSQALGVPQFALLSSELQLSKLIPDFRFNSQAESDLGFSGLKAIYDAEDMRVLLRSLLTELRPNKSRFPARQVPSKTSLDEAEIAAHEIRDKIDFSFNDLASADAPAELFQLIRSRIEIAGVGVIVRSLRSETFRGFCISDDVAPLIFLNNADHNISSRTFSLVHELAHVFMRSEGISDPFYTRRHVEKFCNRVAGSLLLPRDEFATYLTTNKRGTKSPRTWVRNISADLKISQQAIAVRIDQLGFERNFYRAWLESMPKRAFKSNVATINDEDVDDADADLNEDRFVRTSARSVVARKYGYFILQTLSTAHQALGFSKYDIKAFTGIEPEVLGPATEFARAKAADARS